jgi:MFS family permease
MATILSDRTAVVDERIAIYLGAFIQGAVWVIFAAFTGVFIERHHYALSLMEYGALFLPLVLAGVFAALYSSLVGCRLRPVHAYLTGLGFSLVAMALLIASEGAQRIPVSYPLLLASSACVGAGGGLVVPFLRCYAVSMRPLVGRRQIILVNALLAAGMGVTPVYALLTIGTGAWWSLPLLLGVLLIAEMVVSRCLRTPAYGAPVRRADRRVSPGMRAYPVLALLYGICIVYDITAPHHVTGSTSHVHLTMLVLAEAAFWAVLLQGSRVVFAIIDGMRSGQHICSIAAFVIAVAIAVLSLAVSRYDIMHLGLYLLAAIGCAALLPIDTRPGNEHISVLPLAVAGGIIALFPLGLGLSRYGYDTISSQGMTSFEIFISMALLGAAACLLLLPVILNWPTMAYFDMPRRGDAEPVGTAPRGSATALGTLAEPGLPGPRERPNIESWEPGGATAIPLDGPQRDSRRQDQ